MLDFDLINSNLYEQKQQVKPVLVGLAVVSVILAVLSVAALLFLFFSIATDNQANQAEHKGAEIGGFVLMAYPPIVFVIEILVLSLYHSQKYKTAVRWAYAPLFVAGAALVFLFILALLAT